MSSPPAVLPAPSSLSVPRRLLPVPVDHCSDRPAHSLALRDRVVVLAGADNEHGLRLARALAAAGARLLLCGRDESVLWELGRRAHRRGTPVAVAAGDPVLPDDRQAAVAMAMSLFGSVDVLISNGGANTLRHSPDAPADRLPLNLPVIEGLALAEVCAEVMRPGSAIVHVVPSAGTRASAASTDRALELGMLALTRDLSRKFRSRGIRVNGLCVEPVTARNRRAAFGPFGDVAHVSMRMRVEAGDPIADGLVFLAGAHSAGVSGLTLAVHDYQLPDGQP